jgi:translation initiation factor 2B subunit (eIF-2B alpha/beta/delta family)/8-oxo-dGTP pyrophosphatase MutT (NUDIX family)
MSRLERRTVVSILLFPPKINKPYRVLLFRRSENVSTYRNKLAPIAGSVEQDDKTPLDAAWRELKEETCLGPQHIELWRRGPGFEFTDEKAVTGKDGKGETIGRTWHVWPFAFRFKKDLVDEQNTVDTTVFQMNWEHVSLEWNKIDDILSGKILDQCVPRLEITLGQVWVNPESLLHHGLEELRLDHTHGARELATMAVKTLIRIVEDNQQNRKPYTPEEIARWWKTIRLQAFHLALNGRPSMSAAISSAIVTALQDAQGKIDAGGQDVLEGVKQSLVAYIGRRAEIAKRVGEQFSALLHDKFELSMQNEASRIPIKILTLSASSTIKAAILHALDAEDGRIIELRVLESRPLFEGVSLAQTLTREAEDRVTGKKAGPQLHDRLRIIVSTDASVGILSRGADILIIGADRISESGDVSNKTGSLPAVLTSKEVTGGFVKVVCISEADKIAPPGAAEEHCDEDNEKTEVVGTWKQYESPAWDDMVTVRNVYFEWVPAKYIDYYVCEDGILLEDDIKKKSKLVSDLTAKAFTDLQVAEDYQQL